MGRQPRQLGNQPTGIRFAAKSVRSGLRRYPRALIGSLQTTPETSPYQGSDQLIQALNQSYFATAWLGHASVLTRLGSTTLLIDPVLSQRIGVRVGSRTIGLPRITPLPINPHSLRGIDVILITHAHFDHLDRPTLRTLAHPDTTVLVPIGCSSLIPKGYGQVIELAHDATAQLGPVGIHAIEPAHWGARRVTDRHRHVNAYVVEDSNRRVLFAGDTAETDAFDSLTDIDVAMMGIGAYDPWEHMHATPEQVWGMFNRIGARRLLPIHHSTFELSDEPRHEPMERLKAIAGIEQLDRIIPPILGELVDLDSTI